MRALLLIVMLLAATPAFAGEGDGAVRSVTIEGGPVASQHFQTSDDNFHERHGLGIVKVETAGYGTWGLYVLMPNSVEKNSVGVGYVTPAYVVPLGPTELELTGALGLVTGYQDYPLPMLAGEARLRLYESGAWNAGIAMAVMPYVMEDRTTDDNEFGVVAVSPFLSVRYRFAQ